MKPLAFDLPIHGDKPREHSIAVIAPDSSVWLVPMSQAQQAVQAGGELAMRVHDPMGRARWVPLHSVHEALNAGGRLSGETKTPSKAGEQVPEKPAETEPNQSPAPSTGEESAEGNPEENASQESTEHIPIKNVLDAAMQLGAKWGASRVSPG